MTPAPKLSIQLSWASRGLQAVLSGQSSTDWLNQCPVEVRPGVQALLMMALRQLGTAKALRQRLVPKSPAPAVDALLTLSLGVLLQDPPPYATHTLVSQAVDAAKREPRCRALAALINASLRRFVRERSELLAGLEDDIAARWNHPPWWVEQLRRDHPEAWTRILGQARHKPPLVLRVNPRKTDLEAWMQRAREAGLEVRHLGAQAVWLPQPVPVAQIPGFAQGQCSVQDWAAQLAAPLLLDALGPPPADRPWRVLDACAAPGGKTAHLLELSDADVLAVDVDPHRLTRVQENLTRLGLRARTLAADAALPQRWAQPHERFDGILLDAPCSASGIVRRHPDIPWLRRAEDLPALAQQQQALLQGLWPLLRPGGHVVYCTCSVFKSEGENQVQTFLANNTDAVPRPAAGHLIPGASGNRPIVGDNEVCEPDGFFYALLQKAV